MAIQTRRGNKANFESDRLQPGEIATALDTGEVFMRIGGGVISLISPGQIKEIAYDTADAGWLLCQGQAINRTTYAALFAKIGTKYGAGDGSTTFNLPPRNGRVGIGLDPNDADFGTLGKVSGSKDHTNTIDEMAKHNHAIFYPNDLGPYVAAIGQVAEADTNKTWGAEMVKTDTTGGSKPYSILPPNVVMNYEIYTGVFN